MAKLVSSNVALDSHWEEVVGNRHKFRLLIEELRAEYQAFCRQWQPGSDQDDD